MKHFLNSIFYGKELKKIEEFKERYTHVTPLIEQLGKLNIKHSIHVIDAFNNVFAQDEVKNIDLNEVVKDIFILLSESDNSYQAMIISLKYGLIFTNERKKLIKDIKDKFQLDYFIGEINKLFELYKVVEPSLVALENEITGYKTDKQLKDLIKTVESLTNTKYNGTYELDDLTLYFIELSVNDLVMLQRMRNYVL